MSRHAIATSPLARQRAGSFAAPAPAALPILRRTAAYDAHPGGAPPVVHDVLRSSGRPLDPSARAFFEPRFGHHFGEVRVHTDAPAAASARAVGALAYTVGRDVVFGQGQYAPQTPAGRRLLAHELAHVVQQGAATAAPGQRLAIGDADGPAEAQAARIAAAVMDAGSATAEAGAPDRARLPEAATFLLPPSRLPERAGALAVSAPVGGVLLRQATHPDPDCDDLLAQIVARVAELAERAGALIRNPLNLPPTGPMSVAGHQQQFRNKQVNLRSMLNQWDTNGCGPGYLPQDAWQWATRPTPAPVPQPTSSSRIAEPPKEGSEITTRDVATVVGAGVGAYVLYRAVRMLPSLLPPLWWTIPANAAVP